MVFKNFSTSFLSLSLDDVKKGDASRRIYSGKHFESYFNEDETFYTKISSDVDNIFNYQNEEFLLKLTETINNHSKFEEYYLLDIFATKINVNCPVKFISLICHLAGIYRQLTPVGGFLQVSARFRCATIISSLLLKFNDEEVETAINSFQKNDLCLLFDIQSIISKQQKEGEQINDGLINKIGDLVRKFSKEIVLKRENIYDKKLFLKQISWVISKEVGNYNFRNYLLSTLDADHVFVFLVDCFSYSISTQGFEIAFNPKILEGLYSIESIEGLLKQSIIDSQKKRDIYQIFMNGLHHESADDFDRRGLIYKEPPSWFDKYYD